MDLHDAAVAHAFIKAKSILRAAYADFEPFDELLNRTVETVLQDDFGIPATQRSEGESVT